MTWLIRNWRIVCLGLSVLTVLAIVVGGYFKGHANGYSQAKQECNQEKLETINENIQIIDKALAHDNRTNDAYIRWLQSQQN